MALTFNGSSNSVTTPHSISGYGITTAYTMHCWFWPNNNGTMSQGADDPAADTGGALEFFQVSGTPATFWARCKTGSGTVTVTGGSVNNTAWNSTAAVYNGANFAVWGNGLLAQSLSQTGTVTSTGQNLLIGQRGGVGTNLWNGRIADFALWSVALTQSEIIALYSGVRPGNIRPNVLKGWWIDAYGYGGSMVDRSGNGNFAILSAAAPTFVLGPPLINASPIVGKITPKGVESAAASGSVVFRKTLSPIGTRTGSRQALS